MSTETIRAAGSGILLESVFGDSRDVFSGVAVKERSGRVKYWKRYPDGWIQRGPDIRTDPPKWQQFTMTKRWRELPDSFGIEVQGVAGGTIQPNHPPRGGQEHQWLQVFFKNGGLTYICTEADTFGKAGEYLMPASQIVSMGLHRDPEVKRLRPDVADVPEIECPYGCVIEGGARRVFAATTQEEAQKRCDMHVAAVHKEAVASQAVGNAIAKATSAKQGQEISPDLVAQIVAATVAALNGVQQQAVASLAVEEPKKPAAPRYPEGDPAPDWKRQWLMAWAADNGYEMPENRMAMSRDQWFEYISAGRAGEDLITANSPGWLTEEETTPDE